MHKKWLAVLATFGVLFAASFALWFWSDKKTDKEPKVRLQKPEPQLKPGMTLEGVEGFVLRREGRKIWELFVDIITLDKNQTQATAQGIRKAIYYDEKGKPLFWLSAQNLVYNANTGEVTLTGNIQVEARLSKGRMLFGKATQAIWHERKRILEIWDGQGQVDETRFLVRRIRYNPATTVLEAFDQVVVFTTKARLVCPMVRTNLTTRYLIAFPPVQLIVLAKKSSTPFLPVSFRKVAQDRQQQKAEKEKKERPVNFRTDKPVVRKPPRWFFEDVAITEDEEDYTITAKRAIYDEDADKVEIPEGIRFEDPETLATAPKGEVDNKQKIAIFFGPVEVIIKPQKEPKKPETKQGDTQPAEQTEGQKEGKQEKLRERLRKEGGKMICDKAEYYYRERRIVAIGNVKFEQEGRYSGRADKVTYLTQEEILTIEGNVVMRDLRKGHEVECPKVVINLQTDEVEISPPVKGRLIVREEEEEKQKPQPEKGEKDGK
ncbi:MAG: LPS export ABC transporter periplasmic protein LptC [Armatimonadota bacterium]|nr:LPS export ABC transporter periplasmic protein LptC [Armatimonadota bacterium]MDW8142024.1 LPS export ABC transporter periplasmic protein LptC [Armatimonadota bacterium]